MKDKKFKGNKYKMAIYHFSAQTISRSQGRSAVGCSAYRSAMELFDERYGKTHDYTKKEDVAYSEIMLSKDAPLWMMDREKLWNYVESCEKRKDAQLAREIQVSLPRELTLEQNIELIKEFVQKEFIDKGMIADVAIHTDKSSDGELQPHAHVMLTMREVTMEGFGQKVREWNAKENLLEWREHWAEIANRHLALNGHDITIDHRSNLDREINLEPQHKIGTSNSRHQLDRIVDHECIAFENGEKIYRDPQIALDALTRQQSTFTNQDLARFINRHTKDAQQFERVYEKVKASEQIISLGFDEKDRERFTTKEMLEIEKRMIQRSQQMVNRTAHNVSINSHFEGLRNRQLSDEQRNAYDHLLEKGDLKCVVGYAGTGKSYLLGAAREAWERDGYRVLGATLAGIAAENLQASSGIESRTLASRMYYWDRGEQLLTHKDILVVDEAGMFGSRQMEQLLKHVQEAGAKAVLIGDPQQLQAIEAGAAFRAIIERTGYVELTEIRRQEHEWQRQATKEFARGNIEEGLTHYKAHDNVHEFETQAFAKKAMVELWNDARIANIDQTQIMLSYTRKDAAELNDMARNERQKLGELGEAHILSTVKGHKEFAENDRIYFLKNERNLGVKNGSLGTVEKIEHNQLTVKLDKEKSQGLENKQIVVDLDKYNHIDHGYAATIHKAQGVTVDRSYLLTSKHMDGHATYVGMSRHRESADLFYSREEFNNEKALNYALGRERAKDVTIDYSYDQIRDKFAENRNIEVSEMLAKEVERSSSIEKANEKENTRTNEKPTEKEINEQRIKDIDREPQHLSQKENEVNLENKSLNFEAQYKEQRQKDIDELMAFKKQFEKENPEISKKLASEMIPEPEKRAMLVEKTIRELNEQVKQNPRDFRPKEELRELISKIAKDKELMENLKERAPALTAEIKVKAKELERDRNICRSL